MDAERWARMNKIYRSLSAGECRQLRALARGDRTNPDMAMIEKFIELKLVILDSDYLLVTFDGQHVATGR